MNGQDLMDCVADDEATPDAVGPAARPWRILVVHESTTCGLRGLGIEGRPSQVLHASSGAEALALFFAGRGGQDCAAVVRADTAWRTIDTRLAAWRGARGAM